MSPPLILNYTESILKASTELIAAYFQSVLDGRVTMDHFWLQAECPFHIDNDESFVVDLQNGDYRCRCSSRWGSIQQFEMRRAGEAETPRGWTTADERILAIANKALAKSHA